MSLCCGESASWKDEILQTAQVGIQFIQLHFQLSDMGRRNPLAARYAQLGTEIKQVVLDVEKVASDHLGNIRLTQHRPDGGVQVVNRGSTQSSSTKAPVFRSTREP